MGNYVSENDVKNYSRITYTDLGYSSDDDFVTFLSDLITQIEAVIDAYCGVPLGFFKAGGLTFTDERYDYDPELIQLKHYPILNVTKVEYNKAGYGQSEDWEEISNTYYILYSEEGLLKIVNKVPAIKERSIRVSYTAGYSSVPDAIKYVCIQLCSNYLHTVLQRKISPIIRISEFTVQSVLPTIFTPELKKLLAHYVRRQVTSG